MVGLGSMAETSRAWTGRGIALIALGSVPFVYHQNYFLHVMGLAMIAATAALGMQLLIGFSGQLSMGQAGAAGGYLGMVEAMRQLLGVAEGRQIVDARHALVSGFGMINYDRGLCSVAAVLGRA